MLFSWVKYSHYFIHVFLWVLFLCVLVWATSHDRPCLLHDFQYEPINIHYTQEDFARTLELLDRVMFILDELESNQRVFSVHSVGHCMRSSGRAMWKICSEFVSLCAGKWKYKSQKKDRKHRERISGPQIWMESSSMERYVEVSHLFDDVCSNYEEF